MTILPEVSYIDLTPVVAAKFLHNVHPNQRRLKESQVKNLSSALVNGDFKASGQTIQTDIHGFLVNGQHTCAAIRDTGITVTHIKYEQNVPEDTLVIADAGAGRTTYDQIKAISGHSFSQTSTATLKILLTKPSSNTVIRFKDPYHRDILKKYESVRSSIDRLGGFSSSGNFAMIPRLRAAAAAAAINVLEANPQWENGNHIMRWCHIAQHGKPHFRDPLQSLSAAEAMTALAWYRHATKENKRFNSRETMLHYRQLCRLMIHFIKGSNPFQIKDALRAPENLAMGRY